MNGRVIANYQDHGALCKLLQQCRKFIYFDIQLIKRGDVVHTTSFEVLDYFTYLGSSRLCIVFYFSTLTSIIHTVAHVCQTQKSTLLIESYLNCITGKRYLPHYIYQHLAMWDE